jgi:hypothetical protein
MRIRFTMRDFMWLLAVLGVALGWYVEHWWRATADRENVELRQTIKQMDEHVNSLYKKIDRLEAAQK